MENTINNTADSSNKIPDKKLYIGAKMGLITNIITIVWVIIQAILIFTLKSMFLDKFSTLDSTGKISGVSTMFTVVVVIGGLIAIGISILLIIMCNNVLKGKAKSGLTVGIVMLVLAGLMLVSMTSLGLNSITGANIIFIGLNIAAGVLLVMGKYESNKETTTEAVPSVASVDVE